MPDSIECPVCGKVSHHPDDIANKWCARCNAYTAECAVGRNIIVLGGVPQAPCPEQAVWRVALRQPGGRPVLAGICREHDQAVLKLGRATVLLPVLSLLDNPGITVA